MTGRSYSFGTLQIVGQLLLVGGLGQAVCGAELFSSAADHGSPVLVFGGLIVVPWMLVFWTTGLKGPPPFGPKFFRRCLLFIMVWYGSLTLLVEAASVFRHFYPLPGTTPPPWVRFITRGMMDIGLLSFIPYIRECIFLRHLESKMLPNP